jgi:hypothetical protein
MTAILAYCMLLGVRHFAHGDAAYFSVNLFMPIFNAAVSVFEILLGYKPTIIFVLEIVACFLLVMMANVLLSRIKTALGHQQPVERRALTRSLIMLFVLAPIVYVASTKSRNSFIGSDPHLFNKSQTLLISSGKSSVDSVSFYVSPHTNGVSSDGGELVLVEDIPEEVYQLSKSRDAKDKKPAPKSTSIVAADFSKGQDPHVYSIMKDLGRLPFMSFCGFGIAFSALGSVVLDKII